MEKELYKNIVGIDTFWQYFPDKPWHHFYKVLEFRWYKEFNYEEWTEKAYLDLKMTEQTGRDIVLLKFIDISGNGIYKLDGYISGLDIINLRRQSAWIETQYEVIDFEESNIHFYCSDIEVKVLTVNGVQV